MGLGIAFVLHPDGRRIAALSTTPAAPDDDITAVPVVQSRLNELPGNELVVVDLETGEVEPVADVRAVAWYWSPTGDHLLFATLEQEGTDQFFFRWNVWDGNEVTELDRFLPSATLLSDYLPFFDQYDRSIDVWAPDGSAFVYVGTDERGDSGVWVQTLEPGSEPVLVGPGVFAVWSPL